MKLHNKNTKTTPKIALVTGANQGIGFATVELLLAQGISVILTARDEAKGIKAVQKLSRYEQVYFHQLDVSDADSVAELAKYVTETFGKLDILINNAGINYDTWQNALNADLNEVQQTLDTNVMGTWRMIQAVAPLLKKSPAGRIVNVSSGGGSLDSQTGGTPAYSLSKLALNGLTLQFAQLLKIHGILVNSVCPGWVRTQMGGMAATRSPKKGAETIVWAASDDNTQSGQFFRDKQVIDW